MSDAFDGATDDDEVRDDVARARVLRRLFDGYVSDSRRNIALKTLVEHLELPPAQVALVARELVEQNLAYGMGEPLLGLRLNDNGFAYANDALRLEKLERPRNRA